MNYNHELIPKSFFLSLQKQNSIQFISIKLHKEYLTIFYGFISKLK